MERAEKMEVFGLFSLSDLLRPLERTFIALNRRAFDAKLEVGGTLILQQTTRTSFPRSLLIGPRNIGPPGNAKKGQITYMKVASIFPKIT
ncbi:MAG: hypothetical protein GY795_30190 [Desulfobacterales bacterium]|nr:hypothetical protein [Desulfobacterales bacterium]